MKRNATHISPHTAPELTAKAFLQRMEAMSDPLEKEKIQRYFKSGKGEYGEGDQFMGIRMGHLFALAKEHMAMPLPELEKLLEHALHEARAGALSIMDKKARSKKTSPEERQALFELYLRRHDRINNWDLVDLAAIHVIGGYLLEKDRTILYHLAQSKNMWERRTAIVSTAYFIKHGQVEDTFKIATLLLNDKEDLIHKAAGGWIREAGKNKHRQELLHFLDQHAATMPRTMLRYAIEHFSPEQKKQYLLRKSGT